MICAKDEKLLPTHWLLVDVEEVEQTNNALLFELELFYNFVCTRVFFCSKCFSLFMYSDDDGWKIRDFNGMIGESASLGRHPCSIYCGEWRIHNTVSELYFEHFSLDSSLERPFFIHEIGVDFFLRIKTHKLV